MTDFINCFLLVIGNETPDCSLKLIFSDSKKGNHYEYKYLDYAQSCLTRYLCLNELDQATIFYCAENGLSWRGDDIELYKRMYVLLNK